MDINIGTYPGGVGTLRYLRNANNEMGNPGGSSDPLTNAINQAAYNVLFVPPNRNQVLSMVRAYAPIMGLNAQTDWENIFLNTQRQQISRYNSWSNFDNPSQTFFKVIQWNNFPNNDKVKSYVESTPEYKQEAQAYTDAWNRSNQSSGGSFFSDLLGIGSIAVAFMFPELAGFVGEAMGFGEATSAAAIVAGNATMSAGVAAVEGKSPEEILKAAATGALGGVAQQAAIASNPFLQSMMDAGVPWDIVQSIPKAGIGSLAGAVTSALQGKDVLSGLVTGGSLSLLGGSVTNALTSSGVSPLTATAAAQGLNQLIMTGDINPEILAKNAALGIVDPQVSKVLQDAGIPTEAIPTAVRAVNQVLTTGDINPQSLALAATGQFASDQLKGALPSSAQTTPVAEPEVIPSTPLAPETDSTTPTAVAEATSPLEQAATPETPALKPAVPDTIGALTQVASGPTMTDVPVQEKNWGEPGYIYPDGTVEPEVKSGLDSVTAKPIPSQEVVPSTPVGPETTGGLSSIEDQVAQQEQQTDNVTTPDVTTTDIFTGTDPYAGDPNALVPITTPDGNTVYMDPNTGDVASDPTQVVTDPYFTTDPSFEDLGGETGGLPKTPASTPSVTISPTTTSPGTTTSTGISPSTTSGGGLSIPWLDTSADVLRSTASNQRQPLGLTNIGALQLGVLPSLLQQGRNVGSISESGFASGGSTTTTYDEMVSCKYGPKFAPQEPSFLQTMVTGRKSPLTLQQLKQLQSHISAHGNMGGLAQGGLPKKYQDAAPDGHNPEFITGLTGYYADGRGTGQSDDIPALLHDGDYVMDAETVSSLGDGSSKAGREVLDGFRQKIPHSKATGGRVVPAKIADGEYVFPAEFVTALGSGDNKRGAAILDGLREKLRAHKRAAPLSKIPPKAKSPLEYIESKR